MISNVNPAAPTSADKRNTPRPDPRANARARRKETDEAVHEQAQLDRRGGSVDVKV